MSTGVALAFTLMASSVNSQAETSANGGTATAGEGEFGKLDALFFEEIIVTAEKREQNVQDVPFAISAFSADMIQARGIDTPEHLGFSVPALVISKSPEGGAAKVTMRGIGQEGQYAGSDPGVPIHINGHYTQSTAYIFRDFFDVERVEVQRGPQGTLYGRNAVGGNINVITKRPTRELEGTVSIDVGDYNKRQIQAVVSGPFSDRLRGRLALSNNNRDGFVKNIGTEGKDHEASDYTAVRGSMEIDVTNSLEVYLTAFDFKDTGDTISRTFRPTNTSFDPFVVATNTPTKNLDESRGVAVDISWTLDTVEFRSSSAWDDTTKTSQNDFDASDAFESELTFYNRYDTFSQEFQLLSTGEGDLKWVAGIFYYDEKSKGTFGLPTDHYLALGFADQNGDGVFDENDPSRAVLDFPSNITSKSKAIYGQIDYSYSDRIEYVLGLRYTKDEKSQVHNGATWYLEDTGEVLIQGSDTANSNDWSEVTGKIGISYHFDEDIMAYASFSRGYKAGGFNFQPIPGVDPSFDPEILDALESGVKSQLLSNRLQLNMAVFFYDYQDKQEYQRRPDPSVSSGFAFQQDNAAEVTAYGFEWEIKMLITESFRLDTAGSWMFSEYDKFLTVDNIDPDKEFYDVGGNRVTYSPEWKIQLGAEYDWELGTYGKLSARLDYSWTDETWANALNRPESSYPDMGGYSDLLDSYSRVNARLKWQIDNWDAELWARNLTDEITQSHAFTDNAALAYANYYAPRTYGLKLTYSF